MKKTTFTILLIVEIILGFISVGLLLSDFGGLSYLFAAALFAIVLFPFFRKLKGEKAESKKAKIRRNAVLVMLIPTLAAIVAIAYVVFELIAYFN